jgi:hypothetical protein
VNPTGARHCTRSRVGASKREVEITNHDASVRERAAAKTPPLVFVMAQQKVASNLIARFNGRIRLFYLLIVF